MRSGNHTEFLVGHVQTGRQLSELHRGSATDGSVVQREDMRAGEREEVPCAMTGRRVDGPPHADESVYERLEFAMDRLDPGGRPIVPILPPAALGLAHPDPIGVTLAPMTNAVA